MLICFLALATLLRMTSSNPCDTPTAGRSEVLLTLTGVF